jgi:hypothetical protein
MAATIATATGRTVTRPLDIVSSGIECTGTWTKFDLKKGGLFMKANQRHAFSRHDGAHYDAAAMANGQTSEFLKQQLL